MLMLIVVNELACSMDMSWSIVEFCAVFDVRIASNGPLCPTRRMYRYSSIVVFIVMHGRLLYVQGDYINLKSSGGGRVFGDRTRSLTVVAQVLGRSSHCRA